MTKHVTSASSCSAEEGWEEPRSPSKMIFMPWKQLTSLRKANFASRNCSHVQAIQDTHTAFRGSIPGWRHGSHLPTQPGPGPAACSQCLCHCVTTNSSPCSAECSGITVIISNYCSDALMFASPKPPCLASLGNPRAEPSAAQPCSSSSCFGPALDHGLFPHGIVFI